MSGHTNSCRRSGYECDAEQKAAMRKMFAQGMSRNHIASQLGISDHTVKRHTLDMTQGAPRKRLSPAEHNRLMRSWR